MSARPCTWGYNQCWHQDYYFANNLLSDDVYGSRHSTNETSIVTGMANTSNGRFSDEWDKCYQELRTIHTALDAHDRMNIDETFKTRMLAELRLMRAFPPTCAWLTWFGDVPFFTTNPTLPESRVVKVTPAATIKEFIHSELAEVAEILPKNTDIPESENGRYTRGTAVALNARAYLYDNDFENLRHLVRQADQFDGVRHLRTRTGLQETFSMTSRAATAPSRS